MANHDIVVHDTSDPATKAVECTCGARWLAFFGEPHARAIIEAHHDEMGVAKTVIFH